MLQAWGRKPSRWFVQIAFPRLRPRSLGRCWCQPPSPGLARDWRSENDTLGVPRHPCVHADPRFPDLAPGEGASIRGKLIFFEGSLDELDPKKYLAGE